MRNLKKLMKNYKDAQRRFDVADAAWENDYENEDLEKAWDIACKESDKALDALVKEIVKVTGGRITHGVARVMVLKHEDRLTALIAQI